MSPTESEAHAITVAGIVVVVVATRSCDIVEVRSVADIRRTQPRKRNTKQAVFIE